MSEREDDLLFEPQQFSGRARLFPLPNLVLFPHVVQPLCVFEPRYVELFEDALAGDRMITMTLLEPGWESDYDGRPSIAPVGCLGRILSWQAQGGGRYNLLLLGLSRVRVLHELEPARSFREAQVALVADDYPAAGGACRQALQRRLIAAIEKTLPQMKEAGELFNQLAIGNVALGTLTDVISYAIDLGIHGKQQLLSEPNVDRRAEMLVAHLNSVIREPANACPAAAFPPSFSAN